MVRGADMGRHSIYTPALAAEICDRISRGEPLEVICRDEGMPASRNVREWVSADSRPKEVPATFASDFARAREDGYDAIAADCLEIADDGKNDWMAAQAADGDERAIAARINGEHVQRSKLRIETRLKLLAKWSKRYGDRVGVEHSGAITMSQILGGLDGADAGLPGDDPADPG